MSDMKEDEKAQTRFLIQQYFKQFNQGCSEKIINHSVYCCHNPSCKKITDPNDAAIKAMEFAKEYKDTFLCCYMTPSDRTMSAKSIHSVINRCENGNYSNLVRIIHDNFSFPSNIDSSFTSSKKQEKDDQFYFQGLDLEDIGKIYNLLLDLRNNEINLALQKSVTQLSSTLKYNSKTYKSENSIKPFIFLLINPIIFEIENRNILANLCIGILNLSIPMLKVIENWFLSLPKEQYSTLLTNFQQFISVKILWDQVNLEKDESIIGACTTIELLYNVNEIKKYVSYIEFYNDPINNNLVRSDYLPIDFTHYTNKNGFTYTTFPFILDTNTKNMYLKIEHTLEQNQHIMRTLQRTSADYLILRVERDHLIPQTLNWIQKFKTVNKNELKKELKIQFIGEDGIDQGGVQKEFFQLVVRSIFNPQFGMFTYNESTRTFWFNPDSEDFVEFELIGIILGLALYNTVILDVHFPLVIYKKLLNLKIGFEDIESIEPMIYQSLVKLRESEEDVSSWMTYFCVQREKFGQAYVHELKKGGEDIVVDNSNRDEYLKLYADYLLNDSVSAQWNAFYKGFRMVCDSQFLKLLRAEELADLICGVEDLDFGELEKIAVYEGGYSTNDTTIRFFWQVLHGLNADLKRKFLFFTTGSDRVPYGGLKKLGFSITKTADSDRLPSAHTCFNALILPAYTSKEKLEDRLLKALHNAEGFGLR
eukprot:gene3196-4002_t